MESTLALTCLSFFIFYFAGEVLPPLSDLAPDTEFRIGLQCRSGAAAEWWTEQEVRVRTWSHPSVAPDQVSSLCARCYAGTMNVFFTEWLGFPACVWR